MDSPRWVDHLAAHDPIVFECPKCLGRVSVPRESAGTRVPCPLCEVSLLVPEAFASGGGFEDLFDEPATDPVEPGSPQDDVGQALEIALQEDLLPFDSIDATGGGQAANQEDPAVDTQETGPDEVDTPGGVELAQESDEFELQLAPLDEEQPVDQGKDPFEVDPDAPLKIEGLEMEGDADQVFGLKCPVCDTRIHVNLDQVGSTVKCPVCFSNVPVTLPIKQPKSRWEQPDSETDAGDELKREAPANPPRPEEEIQPGYGLEPVDRDLLKPISIEEDEIVDLEILEDGDEIRREVPLDEDFPPPLGMEDVDELQLEDLPDEDGDEIQREVPLDEDFPPPLGMEDLDELQLEDLPDEPTAGPGFESGSRADSPGVSVETPTPSAGHEARWREEPGSESVKPEAPTETAKGGSGMPEASLLSGLKELVDWMGKVSKSPHLIVATLVSLVLFTIGYSFFDQFYDAWGDEEAGVEPNVLGMIGYGFLGCLFWLPSAVLFCVTFSVLFRDSAEGDAEMQQWPDSAFSEWFVTFAFTAVSFWAASLPGLLFGSILLFAMEGMLGLLVLVPIFVFLIIPVCLVSALFNESVVNIFSIDVIRSFSVETAMWLRLYQVILLLLLVFLVGTLILYLPTIVFSFLGALIQVVAALALSAAIGLHAGQLFARMK